MNFPGYSHLLLLGPYSWGKPPRLWQSVGEAWGPLVAGLQGDSGLIGCMARAVALVCVFITSP